VQPEEEADEELWVLAKNLDTLPLRNDNSNACREALYNDNNESDNNDRKSSHGDSHSINFSDSLASFVFTVVVDRLVLDDLPLEAFDVPWVGDV